MSIAATSRGGAAHWNGPRMGLATCDGSRCARAVANIRHWQTKVRQPPFRDIAYNHLVCPGCGRVHEGRGWGVRSASNGTNTGNTEWHGWMVLSGEGEPFTDRAKAGLLALNAEHRRRYGRSRLTTHSAVRGGTTDCPGPEITRWVADGAPGPIEEEDDMTPDDLYRSLVPGTDESYALHQRHTLIHLRWLRTSGIPAVLEAVEQAVKAAEAAASGDTKTARVAVVDAAAIAERVRRELADALSD